MFSLPSACGVGGIGGLIPVVGHVTITPTLVAHLVRWRLVADYPSQRRMQPSALEVLNRATLGISARQVVVNRPMADDARRVVGATPAFDPGQGVLGSLPLPRFDFLHDHPTTSST